MKESILYKLNSGKPIKLLYFIKKYCGLLIPNWYHRKKLFHKLNNIQNRDDYQYIIERVNYYCKQNTPWKVSDKNIYEHKSSFINFTGSIKDYHRKLFHTVYYFDQHDVMKYFPQTLRWNYKPGDVNFTPENPTIVKSRLISDDNTNSVVLKLDKLRHFIFVKDTKTFSQKNNLAIFRGKIRGSKIRVPFLKKWISHPMIDAGMVSRQDDYPEEWIKPKITLKEHLNYKFIFALEGNDVASNLKWVMSSNSLAIMTRPTCETWFMEGKLIPNYHYVEVANDFSDVIEKMEYYINHPKEAEEIIKHAHEFVSQFLNEEREELIQILVAKKYFETSGQNII